MVTAFVQRIFRTGHVPPDMNESLICLIPKQHRPEAMAHFRPICLSNVIMKIVSKVIANRFKPVMPVLVGREQSSFISGRHATDNIVVAQEMIHSLRKRKGLKGALVAKIDLEKAYDRVDWEFLADVLQAIGLGHSLLTVIMNSIKSTQLAVIWNGERLEKFRPE